MILLVLGDTIEPATGSKSTNSVPVLHGCDVRGLVPPLLPDPQLTRAQTKSRHQANRTAM